MADPQPWNWMQAETALVERIKQLTQQGADKWARAVMTKGDLESVAEEQQACPAVYVIYGGFAVKAASDFEATLVHRWLVVLAESSAADQRSANARNQAAGPRLAALMRGLHGMRLPGARAALVPVTPPQPYYSPAKFAYYPLAFTCETYHCVDPQ